MIFYGLTDKYICTQKKNLKYNFNHWATRELCSWTHSLVIDGYTPIGPTILVEWVE